MISEVSFLNSVQYPKIVKAYENQPCFSRPMRDDLHSHFIIFKIW